QHSEDRASGGVRLAAGAFYWSCCSCNGYTRVYQYAASGGFLTTRTEVAEVYSTSNFAERQFSNGIRFRPGIVLSQNPDNLRPDLLRLLNRPQINLDIPLDRSFGQPADAL